MGSLFQGYMKVFIPAIIVFAGILSMACDGNLCDISLHKMTGINLTFRNVFLACLWLKVLITSFKCYS